MTRGDGSLFPATRTGAVYWSKGGLDVAVSAAASTGGATS